jgi:hypothetical protein
MAQEFTSHQTFRGGLFTLKDLYAADETWSVFANPYACCIEFSISLEQRVRIGHAKHYQMGIVATGFWEHLLWKPGSIQGCHG